MRSTTAVILSALLTSVTAASFSWSCHNNNFPDKSDWISVQKLEDIAVKEMKYAGDNDDEVGNILGTLYEGASKLGIDQRFVLAMLMRESTGNTNEECSDGGASCGLFQVKDGHVPNQAVPSCDSHPQSCPKETIQKMIKCGLEGCDNNGYSNVQDCWNQYHGQYGAVARCYNSGANSVNPQDLGQGAGTVSYVQDIGNILLGASSGATSEQWIKYSCKV